MTTFLDEMRGGKSPLGFTPQSLNYPVADSLINNMAPGQATALRSGWTVERADLAARGRRQEGHARPSTWPAGPPPCRSGSG